MFLCHNHKKSEIAIVKYMQVLMHNVHYGRAADVSAGRWWMDALHLLARLELLTQNADNELAIITFSCDSNTAKAQLSLGFTWNCV